MRVPSRENVMHMMTARAVLVASTPPEPREFVSGRDCVDWSTVDIDSSSAAPRPLFAQQLASNVKTNSLWHTEVAPESLEVPVVVHAPRAELVGGYIGLQVPIRSICPAEFQPFHSWQNQRMIYAREGMFDCWLHQHLQPRLFRKRRTKCSISTGVRGWGFEGLAIPQYPQCAADFVERDQNTARRRPVR